MDPERTRVIHRDLNRTYPTLVRGEGIYLYDDEGNRYIDGSGGSAAVTAIGHGVPEVVNALRGPGRAPRLRPDTRLHHRGGRDVRSHHHRGVRTRRVRQGLVRLRWVRGDRQRGQDGDPISPRTRGWLPPPGDRAARRRFTARQSPPSRSEETRGDAARSRRSCHPPSTSRHAIRIAAARTAHVPSAISPAPTSSNTRSDRSAPTMSPRSSPSPWSAPRSALFPPHLAISSASARYVTATASSSSPTR